MRANLVLSLLLIAIFGWVLIEVSSYRWEVALAPALAAGLGILLLFLELFRSVQKKDQIVAPLARAEVVQFLWLALSILAVISCGFGIGGGLYVFLHVFFMRRDHHRLLTALLCGLAVPVVVFGIFDMMLQIRLFPGLLFR